MIKKFRVWNIKNKSFCLDSGDKYSYDYFAIKLNGEICKIHMECDSSGEKILDPVEFIVQQFTGLLDKNGKEIYEGDIVKYNKDFNFGDIVLFSNGCFFIGDLTINELIHRCWDDFEVTGNIFENSELLK